MTATFYSDANLRIAPFIFPMDFNAIWGAICDEGRVVAEEQESSWQQLIATVSLPRDMFDNLVASWEFSTGTSSSIEEIISDDSFQGIIGLGRMAIPFILEELAKEPSFLIIALGEISGDNPIKPEHRGDIPAMAQDWLDWGRRRDYL